MPWSVHERGVELPTGVMVRPCARPFRDTCPVAAGFQVFVRTSLTVGYRLQAPTSGSC